MSLQPLRLIGARGNARIDAAMKLPDHCRSRCLHAPSRRRNTRPYYQPMGSLLEAPILVEFLDAHALRIRFATMKGAKPDWREKFPGPEFPYQAYEFLS